MLDYLSTQNVMHTRCIDFTLQEYLFVVQVAFKEDMRIAYASVFDQAEFKRNVPSEEQEDYLNKFRQDAETLLQTQACKHLREYIEQELHSYVQEAASTLEDFKFTGDDVQKLLSNLLHNRSESLDDASIRDILSLIKGLYDSGALESGDSFQKHFITIAKKYDAVCTSCGREFYAVEGLDIKCPHCGQLYKWIDNRFYPSIDKL